ncbi:hypothetical protein EV122DRAFT_285421 [Schizophyllum commune]
MATPHQNEFDDVVTLSALLRGHERTQVTSDRFAVLLFKRNAQVHSERIRAILRRRPFQVFASPPPDPEVLPLPTFLSMAYGRSLFSALRTLLIISELLKDDHALISHLLEIWPDLNAWIRYIFPMTHSLSYPALTGPAGKVLIPAFSASVRFIKCFEGLDLSQTQREEISNSQHSIIALAVHLYVGCMTLRGLPTQIDCHSTRVEEAEVARAVMDCTLSLSHAIASVNPSAEEDQIRAEILTELKGHPRRMLRAMGRSTWIFVRSDSLRIMLRIHLDAVSRVTGALHRVYSRVLIRGLLAVIKDFSDDATAWPLATTALSYMCVHNAHALLLMIKSGGLPIIDDVVLRRDGASSLLPDVLRGSLVFSDTAKAIESALNGSPAMTSAGMNTIYEPTRRAAVLLRTTKRRWGAEARCSNSQCVVVGGASLRACACARVVYCSRECQKLHWRNGHRDDCIVDDGNVILWPGHKALRAWDVYFLFQNIQEIVRAHFSLTSFRRDRCAYIILAFSHGAPQLSYDLSPPESAEPRIMVKAYICRTDVEHELTFTFRPTWAEQPRFRLLTEGTLDMWTRSPLSFT